ncbi:metal-dependent transcriptional regulator [Flavihumibacter profundi]|jgi:DtxR family transcriptional regulator, Mn-dependent transcriptional regulator|uniref:metal-dependent transcriptional regulator n=1 Tax=Flavihumibacter profundi TaxID=2716883 RepID=UPI001CC56F14|nr:metal-dependent transcriptional regulator [Flavihumibacter profundi]MBZ5856336.1 metal-dependent transcriptional regulator [Flavihumibacter profundi]
MSNMINPAWALLIGVATLIFIGFIFWPNIGLISILLRSRHNTHREQVEDALKFLFDCEYKNIFCGLQSIASNLDISEEKAARLLGHLTSMGLIAVHGDTFSLTDSGRSYALQVIRLHRIWEKYLADVTGAGHLEWHEAADQKEHRLSIEEADRLAAQIGNPVFDPHGDPIPSSTGEIPEHTGQPLSALKVGDTGRIVHVEDEPKVIYAQLMALGLYPGTQLHVIESADGKIKFIANNEECLLTSHFASAVTVVLIPHEIQVNYALLSSLKLGEKAEIKGISPSCRGQQRRRLMDLGIIPGTLVTAELKSASGDPVAYRILGANIAIRKKQADHIFVNRVIAGQ